MGLTMGLVFHALPSAPRLGAPFALSVGLNLHLILARRSSRVPHDGYGRIHHDNHYRLALGDLNNRNRQRLDIASRRFFSVKIP